MFDRNLFSPVRLGISIIRALHLEHASDFKLEPVEKLLRHPASLEAFKSDAPLNKIVKGWGSGLEKFQKRREGVLLYR